MFLPILVLGRVQKITHTFQNYVNCSSCFSLMQTVFMGKSMSNKADISDLLKDEAFGGYEEIKKDINALTKEEQMDIVYRCISTVLHVLHQSHVISSPSQGVMLGKFTFKYNSQVMFPFHLVII